jgi:actin-related protein 8
LNVSYTIHTDRHSPNSDFLKRDDQILALRLQADERLDRRKRAAVDIDRARAHGAAEGVPYGEPDPDQDVDDDEPMDDVDSENYGSKTIILHPGSQNLRLGLATDALPKTVPMVIARKSDHAESEVSEPRPKRLRTDGPSEEWFGEDFANQYNAMAQEFKSSRRASKRRVLPNSRELVTKWNSTTSPEIISEHNDPLRIEWTDLPADPSEAPEYFVGAAALRIPEKSNPRYKLSWPLRNGWLNERDYQSRNVLERDYFLIIEESIKEQLGLTNKKEWSQYNCVFIIPDLYEKVLIAQILRQLIVDFGFQRVCFIQESLAATFGAGFGIACIIDMGAEKTSVACVEDGMVIEDSRMNLKFGGHDMTETFTKMMLFDRFNYSDFNLMRRHDFLLAEELKEKYTTMSDEAISVQTFEFHLRAHGQQTRKYAFKIYDEGMLAPMVSSIATLFDP